MKTFKQIPSHPKYEVSIDGIVRNATTKKIMSQYIGSTGYYLVTLACAKRPRPRRVHRLVAEAYIPNPENKPEVNHLNGVKTDNSIENLEWCTGLENQRHAFKTGLANNTGENNGISKLKTEQVIEIKNLISSGMSQYKIAALYPIVTRSTILGIKLGRLWKHIKP